MRIATRVAVGLFLMVALLIGAVTYQLSLMERVQEINREISSQNLEAARIAVRVLQGLEGVREFAAKAWVMNDPGYYSQWENWEAAVDEELQRLAGIGLSGEEDAARQRVRSGWDTYQAVVETAEGPAHLAEVEGILVELQDQVHDLMVLNEGTVLARTNEASAAAERARLVAWTAAGAALLIAMIASLLFFRSLSGPLRHLTRGTRELAQGRFDYRLDIQGPGELSGLARDFNHMAARLDELEDLKRDFVSHVSHELKTPLAAIQETVEVLLEEIPGPLTTKQARLLELSRKSSARLSHMISDLLEISRLEAGAGAYQAEPCRLTDMVQSVFEETEPLAAERRLRLVLTAEEESCELVCDPDRIRGVIANLLGNAVKFSPDDETVEVSIRTVEEVPTSMPPRSLQAIRSETGPFVLLSVADRGHGVPDEHKARIFEKFHQLDSPGRGRGQGVGLGLSIVRRVVEAHSGAVWVVDRPGGGAIFEVMLPRSPSLWSLDPEGEELAAPPAPKGHQEGPTRHQPLSGLTPHLLATLLIAAGSTAACAPLLGPPPSPEPVEAPAPAPIRTSLPTIEVPPPTDLRLSRAQALLAAGAHQEAAMRFIQVLDLSGRLDQSAAEDKIEALWGLALIRLDPDSPVYNRERGVALLEILRGGFPNTLAAVQAAWAQSLLEEVERLQLEAERQEQHLIELNQALDRLRQIDLERRPAGNEVTDTVPPGSPPDSAPQ